MLKTPESSSKSFLFRDLDLNILIGMAGDRYAGWVRARIAEEAVWDQAPEGLRRFKKYLSTSRHAIEYIIDTFPIVKRKDEEKHGKYRTKRVILEIYDEMAEAMRSGKPYQTRLNPPPADPSCCHPPRDMERKKEE